jgi:hypothetical protein
MLLVTVVYIPTARYRIDNIFRVSWGASHSILTTYQYINVALLNRWDFDFSGPQPKEPTKKSTSPYGKDTFWNRVKFGFYAASSFRHCGTPFETRGLQPFKRDDPSFVPSTGRFLFAGAIHLVTCYLALDALTSLGDPDKVADLFGEHRIPLLSRLGEVTFQELVERFTCAFAFWLVNYLILSVAGTVLSLFTVATGMAGVIWWKPMFNFGNGFPFTVRRFWRYVELCSQQRRT